MINPLNVCVQYGGVLGFWGFGVLGFWGFGSFGGDAAGVVVFFVFLEKP